METIHYYISNNDRLEGPSITETFSVGYLQVGKRTDREALSIPQSKAPAPQSSSCSVCTDCFHDISSFIDFINV